MKDPIEYLGFDDDEFKPKVGRPKLADKKTKKKSLIVASFSFIAVAILLVFGYGTLFGFKSLNLKGSALGASDTSSKIIKIESLKPVFKNITLKENTSRKIYLTVSPSNATNKEITYESSNNEVAVVDKDGKVTGIRVGNAVITATTQDGTDKKTTFNISVIKNADGTCTFSSLSKVNNGIDYSIDCSNANIKAIYYKVGNGDYSKLLTRKMSDNVPLSNEEKKEKITFKVVYNANNSSISKYSTKTIKEAKEKKETKKDGSCYLNINKVDSSSAKYDITCTNATVTDIAYKIGGGSYIGIDKSSLADTVIFEESNVTRVIYFKVNYKIDSTNDVRTLTKSSIIEKGESTNE